jgi:glycosyltransferase involved in cell wall biosynthesis
MQYGKAVDGLGRDTVGVGGGVSGSATSTIKIAVVHDWLDTWGGAEHVLAEILQIFPKAILFALVDFLARDDRTRLGGHAVNTSFLQRMPAARSAFRWYLPWFPRAVESLDVSHFDLVISSSHAVAKGVRTSGRQLHICYCYTPMRYAWDLQDQYLEQTGLHRGIRGWAARRVLARLCSWDRAASSRVDHFVAISRTIENRINRCYQRPSTVIYPPVATKFAAQGDGKRSIYVTVSRLVPYKRIDAIAEAFRSLPDRELVVIGEGPERARIEAVAGSNVRLLGQVSDGERDHWLTEARAFVFAAEEDFGIAPLEAQAQGTPVIALARGAAVETIQGLDAPTPTGVFFDEQTPASIADAVRRFEAHAARITVDACRVNAKRFSQDRFRREFVEFVDARWAEFTAASAR